MRRQDKLTNKQMGVLYATYKTGTLGITKGQMDLLYEMNVEDTEKGNDARLAMVDAIYCIKHDDYESANETIRGLLETFEGMGKARTKASNIEVERLDASRMTRSDMARALGLRTDVGGFERAWGFPDYSSYSGDPYLDEIGMDIHDLGF